MFDDRGSHHLCVSIEVNFYFQTRSNGVTSRRGFLFVAPSVMSFLFSPTVIMINGVFLARSQLAV